jgi:predicted nucleic acid-binding Zn ribbon protein
VSVAVRPEYQDLPLRQRRLREAGLEPDDPDDEDTDKPGPAVSDPYSGTAVTADDAPAMSAGPGDDASPAARSCPVCGGPVPEGRRVTCSSPCAQTHDQRHRKRTPAAPVRAEILAGLAQIRDTPAPAPAPELPTPAVAVNGNGRGAVVAADVPRALRAVALADDLEAAAVLLRRIAGRLA